jgi:hypothetical protein
VPHRPVWIMCDAVQKVAVLPRYAVFFSTKHAREAIALN